MSIAAGLLAAAVSYAANRFLFKISGNLVLAAPAPLVEETTKNVFAILLGAGIFHSHLVFGLTEAALEWRIRQNGAKAAFGAVTTHAFFGLTATAVYSETGVPLLAILASFMVHWAVNTMVLLRTVKR